MTEPHDEVEQEKTLVGNKEHKPMRFFLVTSSRRLGMISLSIMSTLIEAL
jgi:hypothetical protein